MAGNGDQVGVGLGHAGGDRADAGVRDQLHRHQRRGVHFLEVEDQLRQVFDGIDVVVRRRRNQADARAGVAQRGDGGVDLVAGQLAAFAGFGALGDLDLLHFGVDKVFGRHAEAAGGDLLDLAAFFGAVAGRVFAAFAGIRAPAQAVHRDRQRLVRFRRQRAQADRGGVEAAQQVGGRGHLVERGRHLGALDRLPVAVDVLGPVHLDLGEHVRADHLEDRTVLDVLGGGPEPLRIAPVAIAEHPVTVEIADVRGNGVGDLAQAQFAVTQRPLARR